MSESKKAKAVLALDQSTTATGWSLFKDERLVDYGVFKPAGDRDKRINDMLHKIEFTDATPNEAYKMYMKLQGFLRKRRAIKPTSGNIYVPRTETGNYIIDGRVTKLKKGG